jgi:hypothetical protein
MKRLVVKRKTRRRKRRKHPNSNNHLLQQNQILKLLQLVKSLIQRLLSLWLNKRYQRMRKMSSTFRLAKLN